MNNNEDQAKMEVASSLSFDAPSLQMLCQRDRVEGDFLSRPFAAAVGNRKRGRGRRPRLTHALKLWDGFFVALTSAGQQHNRSK